MRGSNGETEEGAAASEQAQDAPYVAAGTSISFRTTEKISTRTHASGAVFDAVVVSDVTGSDGSVMIPSGARARGVVVQSIRSDGPDPAVLAVELESVEVDGEMLPLQATVTDANVQASSGATGTETVGKVAIGAAAGAILGQILGKDAKSALAGAGVGAAAGAIVAMTTQTGDATLAEGTIIRVRLDEPLRPH